MSKPTQDPFFKSIGSLAEETDLLPDEDEDGQRRVEDGKKPTLPDVDEERPIQEIESLCMHCGEQVCEATAFRESLLTLMII